MAVIASVAHFVAARIPNFLNESPAPEYSRPRAGNRSRTPRRPARIHRPVAALIGRRGLTPGIAAAREFFVGDMEMDTPRIGVDFDLIPGAHESGPSAAMRLSHLKPAGRAQRGRLIVLAQKML